MMDILCIAGHLLIAKRVTASIGQPGQDSKERIVTKKQPEKAEKDCQNRTARKG
jgi:hypothetical protein